MRSPRSWKNSSIEVKERVITVLFSSAQGSVDMRVQSSSKREVALQVTPRVRRSMRSFRTSAARMTSVVSPEREIKTICLAPLLRKVASGAKRNSDAGTAAQRKEKLRDQMAQTS